MTFRHLLLAVALLGLPAGASATRFTYSGSIDSYVVPKDGIYRITARGAGGGSGYTENSAVTSRALGPAGGQGAAARGLFELSAGTTLSLVVGGAGIRSSRYSGGGGGGGSFVFIGSTPYVVGGGGGGGSNLAMGQSASGIGGTGAGGSILDTFGGAPGAGWFGDGQVPYTVFGSPDVAGKSRPSFAGGIDFFVGLGTGGFGGGGSGQTGLLGLDNQTLGGGGGGGYTGGDGGNENGGGFAGTSYVAPFSLASNFTSGAGGNGVILIAEVPEPASWALLVIGFGVIGGSLRGRRRLPA